MDGPTPQRLPIADAALALGLSEKTVRRRIKAGTLKAERVVTAQGFVWLVDIDQVTVGQVDQDRHPLQVAPPADLTRTVVDEVTRSLSRRIEELVRENEQLRQRLAVLEAPKVESGTTVGSTVVQPADQIVHATTDSVVASAPPSRWRRIWRRAVAAVNG